MNANSARALAKATADAERWNAEANVGDLVEYRWEPSAEPVRFATRTEAQVLGGHTSVVWLRGKSGCVCTCACRKVAS